MIGPRLETCDRCGQACSVGGDGKIAPHYIHQAGPCSKASQKPVVLTPQRKVKKALLTANTTREAMK